MLNNLPQQIQSLARKLTHGPLLRQTWFAVLVGAVVATGSIGWAAQAVAVAVTKPTQQTLQLRTSMNDLQKSINQFDARQRRDGRQVQTVADLQNELTLMRIDLSSGRLAAASDAAGGLANQLRLANAELDKPKPTPTPVPAEPAPAAPAAAAATPAGLNVAIIMYHKTPADFEAQLAHLEQTGYSVVTLDQVAAAEAGGAALPAKAAVITFDDGYTDQLTAFDILRRHNMKATFFIINGGPGSGWCIGAGRNDHNPGGQCGDAYLSWDQIRTLDRSGLITIGAHTLDHPCNQNGLNYTLNTASWAQMHHEIADSKTEIEQQIGHAVTAFAYPCGIYDQNVIDEVRADGFTSAVTTIAGTWQPAGQPYALHRIRDAWQLR